jgi:hypothetical protein
MNFDLNTFRQAVINWAVARNGTFQYNWVVKGGWEGWVQVDLVADILSVNTTYDILREQPVYTNARKKTDLLLNADLNTDFQIPVEIKAQSWYNRAGFLPGVEEDLDKLDDERSANYRDSDCVMFGIAFEQGALDGMLAIERGGHTIFDQIYFDGEVAICMATWTKLEGWQEVDNDNISKFEVE